MPPSGQGLRQQHLHPGEHEAEKGGDADAGADVGDEDAEEEARILEEIVSIDPLDGEALILLGQYNGRAGDAAKAIMLYERAAKLEKFEADAKVRHAQLLVGQGKYAEALPLLRSAQQVKPRENIQQYMEQVERVARGR